MKKSKRCSNLACHPLLDINKLYFKKMQLKWQSLMSSNALRALKDACLRPTATFVIFFLHELARAPRTKYWNQLVDVMPMTLVIKQKNY